MQLCHTQYFMCKIKCKPPDKAFNWGRLEQQGLEEIDYT